MGAAFANPAVLSLMAGAGSGLVSSMMGPSTQQRESFAHTGADPVSYATDARASLTNMLQDVAAHANEPIDLSSSLPMSPGSFSALYPSRSVGGFPSDNGTPKRVKFNGLNIGKLGTGASNYGSSGAIPRNPLNLNDGQPQAAIRGGIPDKQIGSRFVAGTEGDPGAQDAGGYTDPTGQGAARLLLHSIFSQG